MQQAEVQTPVKVREFVANEMVNHFRKSLLLSSPAENSKRREALNQRIQAYLNSKDAQGRLELLAVIRQKICQTDIILLDLINRDTQFSVAVAQTSSAELQLSEPGASPHRQERSLESASVHIASDELLSIQAQFAVVQHEIALLDQYFCGKLDAIDTPLQVQILKNAYEVYQAKQQEIVAKDLLIANLNKQLLRLEENHGEQLAKNQKLLNSKLQELQQLAEERQTRITDLTRQLEETTEKLADSNRLVGELRTLNEDLTKAKADLEIQKRIDVEKLTTKTKMVENGRKVAEDLRLEIEKLKSAALTKEQTLEAQIESLKTNLRHMEEKQLADLAVSAEAPAEIKAAPPADQLDTSPDLLRSDYLIIEAATATICDLLTIIRSVVDVGGFESLAAGATLEDTLQCIKATDLSARVTSFLVCRSNQVRPFEYEDR